ncbi:MAG: hypothetical protein WAK18_06145 [Nocardioidaceae bacterium]
MALRTKTRRDKLRSAVHDARDGVQPAADSAMDKISSATGELVSTVAASVGPALEDARDRVKPAVEDARDRLTPMVEDARDKIAPLAQQAVVEGKRRGRRAAERLGVAEEPRKKSHKLRNLVILVGLGGLAAFIYTKMTGKDADPVWTSSRDTAAAQSSSSDSEPGAHASGPVDGSDTAPTAPLASEETVESPQPTTPDKPLRKKKV